MRECPGDSVLEPLALLDEATKAVRRHAARCAACLDRIEQIRQNDRFLLHAAADLAEAIADRPPAQRPARSCPPPGIIPGYQLVDEISRGGQGVVYRAIQTDTRRPVAIKMLLAGAFASERQILRFERETELAAGLRHPNIVTIFQSGVAGDGGRYVAMEFVHGVPLDRFVEETLGPARGGGKAKADAVMRLMLSVALGVGHAHSAGVIHRDIKPSNILVDQQGVPRVLDFGLARAIDPAASARTHTRREALMTESFAGTPAYSAPERLNEHHAQADARGDVYSLGMVLYKLLTDHSPYPSEGPMVAVARHAAETAPTPPSRYAPRLPMDVQTIVLRCLAKDAQRRYTSASALAEDIEAYLGGNPIAARRDSAIYVLRKMVERNRMASAAMAIVALTVLLAAIGFALLAADLDQSRREAEAALSDSTVQRARMMALSGDPQQAESLLWREALRANVASDDGALWGGTPEQLRSVWSLAELYARLPRLMRAQTDGLCASVGWDGERGEIWAVDVGGARWAWSLDGQLRDRTPPPALVDWAETSMASANGRYAVLQGAGRAQVWDLRDRVAIAPEFATDQPAYYARIDDQGRVLMYGNLPRVGGVRVSDARSGVVIAELDDQISGFVMRRDGDGELEVMAGTRTLPVPAVLVGRSPRWAFAPLPGIGEMLDTSLLGGIRNVTPSGDGRLIAASVDCHLYLFGRTPEPALLAHVEVPTKGIDRLAFDAGERSIIVAGRDGMLARYGVPGLEERSKLQAGLVPFALASAGEPPLAILAMLGGGVAVYEASDRPWLDALEATPVTHASLDVAEGGLLAWGDDEGSVFIRAQGRTDKPLRIDAHDGVVTSVAVSPDRTRVVSAGFDGAIREWTIDGVPIRQVASDLNPVSSVRYSPDGRAIACGQARSIVSVWREGQPVLELQTGAYRVPMVAFSPDGESLVCASVDSPDAVATVFDLETGSARYELGGHGIAIRAVAWSPRGDIIATAGDDRTVRIWDASDGRLLRAVTGLPWGPYDIEFHVDGGVLFAVGPGGSIIVLDPLSGVELAKLPVHERHVFSIAIGPDGTTLYTAGEDPWIGVTDLSRLMGYIRGNEGYWRSEGVLRLRDHE